ncbi:MAG: hypothetical protein PHX37_02360, partial [Eubacteriales bacterium]|nr:hypothetical protein [Eubacteriales bacterium]
MRRYFLIIGIITVTLFFMCMYFINPQVEYSPLENRNMSMFSTMKGASFSSGDFQTNLEEALKDQIFLRDSFIMYYSNIKGESRRYYNQALKFFENAGTFIKNIFSSDNGSQIPSETTSVPTTFEAQTSTFPSDTSTSTPTSVAPTTSEAQTGTFPSDTSTSTTTSVAPTTATPTTTETTKFWLEPSGNIYKINGTDQLTYYPFLDNYAKKSNYMIFARQISLLATRHPDV